MIEAIDERTAFVNLSHVLFKIGLHPRRRGDRGPGAGGRRRHDHRRLSVGRHDPRGRRGAGGRRLHRGLPEVALRRAGGGVPLGPPGDPRPARPAPHRLDGARAAVRVRPELERRNDAWRFLHGTPNIPAFYAARAGLEIIRRVGIAAIRAKSLRQTARLIALAEARGYRCTTPRDPDRRGGTVAIDVEHGYEVSLAPEGAGDPLRLPPRRRDPPLPPLLHPRRRARCRRRRHRRDPRRRGLARSRRHVQQSRECRRVVEVRGDLERAQPRRVVEDLRR